MGRRSGQGFTTSEAPARSSLLLARLKSWEELSQTGGREWTQWAGQLHPTLPPRPWGGSSAPHQGVSGQAGQWSCPIPGAVPSWVGGGNEGSCPEPVGFSLTRLP